MNQRRRDARWTVRAGDPNDIRALLGKMEQPESALDEGRVFVDGRRADSGFLLREGQPVVVGMARTASPAQVSVLARRAGLVAVNKPAALPTEPDASGLMSLREQVQHQLDTRLHAVSRLDVGVSGVVLFAATPEARRFMDSRQARAGYLRRYVALATGVVVAGGLWSSPVAGKQAETRLHLLARAPAHSLLRLEPTTGRTHQLRVHASAAGFPLLGDRRYGGASTLTTADGTVCELRRIALHATDIEVHGSDGQVFRAHAPLPREFRQWWQALGGSTDEVPPFAAGGQATSTDPRGLR